MRKHPALPARGPMTQPSHVTRWLNKLAQTQADLEFGSTLEYPKPGHYGNPARPEDEVLVIEIEADDTVPDDDEEGDDAFESLKLTITTYSDDTYSWALEVETYQSRTKKVEGVDLNEAAERAYGAIWPLKKAKAVEAEVKPALEMPSIKLVQHAVTTGPQTTWVSWLAVTKFNSLNELVHFQVACSMVGYAVHICDVDHFLKAIGFEARIESTPRHSRVTRVQQGLKDAVKGKAKIVGSSKLNDGDGCKYLVFLLELADGTGTINGMIDMRPEDADEDDAEVDD